MIDFIDKTSTYSGTPINRANMMAIQGFQNQNTVFKGDGSIEETNGYGHKKTTAFDDDGNILETFIGAGGRTISKFTKFNADGSITESFEDKGVVL